MDGYALALGWGSTQGPFRIRGARYPSSADGGPRLDPGEASYITTGAPLPPGANGVVRVEFVRREGDVLVLHHPARRGQDIVPVGESVRRGDVLLERGERIRPVQLGALLALGIPRVPSFRLRAVVLPIGDELRHDGRRRGRPRVTDYMSPLVASLLPFAEVKLLPPLRDRRAEVARRLRTASTTADLLVTIGGSSAGDRDVTKAAVRSVGKLLFEGVTANVLKRGAVGLIGRVPVVVLPGQLVSAVTVFHEHALHVLSRLVGRELRRFQRVPLARGVSVDHRMDSTYLFSLRDGRAQPLPWGVARLSALLRADAFGVLKHGRDYAAGDPVEVQTLWGSP